MLTRTFVSPLCVGIALSRAAPIAPSWNGASTVVARSALIGRFHILEVIDVGSYPRRHDARYRQLESRKASLGQRFSFGVPSNVDGGGRVMVSLRF